MASNGAADLLADYITERPLSPYAEAFHVDRYEDAVYRTQLTSWSESGQL
jgi:hypothetical protein